MVTLSCLIVVASLFSQIAATTPPSVTPKAIDIIFFCVIVRLFLIVLHHTILYLLQRYVRRKEEEAEAQEKKEEEEEVLAEVREEPGEDWVPGPAYYKPPKVYANSWFGEGVPARPATAPDRKTVVPKLEQESELQNKLKNKNKKMTCDKVFNVLSISFGVILDTAFLLTFTFVMQVNHEAVSNKLKNCSG
nr:uncharacterized protein LOC113809874 [Penaeus vannamei]